MKTISLHHPFTPQAAGVVERSVPTYHSQPHLKAMEMLVKETGFSCNMEYFTPKWSAYTKAEGGVGYTFFPVSFKWNGDHRKWKKQESAKCIKHYKNNIPDLTIINMSGHSSPFSYELSKVIRSKNKQYVAMLGGQHYTDSPRYREYYSKAHHILVHTHLQKASMEKMELFKDLDIRVFPLGVDCSVFEPSAKLNDSPSLLYVGRIVEWKRIHLAIKAVKHLTENGFNEAHLKIIGPVSSESYFNELKKMIVSLNLEENISFLGHKEHNELPKYFQGADLFTLPSDKETFGMVMIEAMACNTPVAGINCPGGPADVITHLENGLLSSPEEYANVVLDFFTNKERAIKIAKNARLKALNEYSIEATYRVLKDSVVSAMNS